MATLSADADCRSWLPRGKLRAQHTDRKQQHAPETHPLTRLRKASS